MPRDGYASLSITDADSQYINDIVESDGDISSRAEAVSHLIEQDRDGDDADSEEEAGVHVASIDPDVVAELARASGADVEGRLS